MRGGGCPSRRATYAAGVSVDVLCSGVCRSSVFFFGLLMYRVGWKILSSAQGRRVGSRVLVGWSAKDGWFTRYGWPTTTRRLLFHKYLFPSTPPTFSMPYVHLTTTATSSVSPSPSYIIPTANPEFQCNQSRPCRHASQSPHVLICSGDPGRLPSFVGRLKPAASRITHFTSMHLRQLILPVYSTAVLQTDPFV